MSKYSQAKTFIVWVLSRSKDLSHTFSFETNFFFKLFLSRQIPFSSFFSNKFLSHAFSFPTNFFFEQVLRSICHQIGNFPSLGAHCRQFYTMIFRIFSMIFRIIPQWFLESTFDDFMTFSVIFRIYFQWFLWSLRWFQNNLSIISIIFPMIFIMIFQWFLLSMIFRKYFQWFNDLFHDFPNTFQAF